MRELRARRAHGPGAVAPRLGAAVMVALLCAACGSARQPRPHRPDLPERIGGKRTLVVAMDAVPYAAIAELTDDRGERLFEELGRPVPLVSTFPSTTTIAFTGIFEPLGIEKPPGYEARFFDLERGRVRGGGLRSYQKIRFSWREFFDWKTRGLLDKWVSYAVPGRYARREIRDSIAAFLATDHDPFFVYVGATDGVAHLDGPGGFEQVLAELDRELAAAHAREDFYTIVLSDHGIGPLAERSPPLRNVRRDVHRALRASGHRISSRTGAGHVSLVPFGLLSSFVVFTEPGQGEEIASLLSGVEGVELCAAPSEGSWVVRDGPERARIERRAGPPEEWRYTTSSGDPLLYEDLAGEWRSSEEWLRLTGTRRFPDGLHRIARAFELVRNPASAICSTSPGFMFGPWRTDWVGRLTVGALRWTHGALEQPDSWGFLLTDHPFVRADGPVTFDEALAGLVAPESVSSRSGRGPEGTEEPGSGSEKAPRPPRSPITSAGMTRPAASSGARTP